MERINTEVLVIGGGAAGLRAAIEAAALGKEVAIVSKGKSGKSGNTALAQCNIAFGHNDDGGKPAVGSKSGG